MAGETGLTHLDSEGGVSMVDVGGKKISQREAVASAQVRMLPATLDLLVRKALPKGDVLTTARVAGILGAKQTASLVPLTHPLALSFVEIDFDVRQETSTIFISATVRCEGKTGVEIEAMTACAIAALTIYDMCKSAEHGITIDAIRLEKKSGGKSGTYVRGG